MPEQQWHGLHGRESMGQLVFLEGLGGRSLELGSNLDCRQGVGNRSRVGSVCI